MADKAFTGMRRS